MASILVKALTSLGTREVGWAIDTIAHSWAIDTTAHSHPFPADGVHGAPYS